MRRAASRLAAASAAGTPHSTPPRYSLPLISIVTSESTVPGRKLAAHSTRRKFQMQNW